MTRCCGDAKLAGMAAPTREQQRRARIFGVLFALTFVTSIAGLLLYDPVLNDADYILGAGAGGASPSRRLATR